jgi:hypothetical protein
VTGFSMLRIRTGSVRRMRADAGEELAIARASRRTDRWTGQVMSEVVAEEWAEASVDAAEAVSRFNTNAGR